MEFAKALSLFGSKRPCVLEAFLDVSMSILGRYWIDALVQHGRERRAMCLSAVSRVPFYLSSQPYVSFTWAMDVGVPWV